VNDLTTDEMMALVAMAANGMVCTGVVATLDEAQRQRLGKALISTRAFIHDNTATAMNEAATAAAVSAIDKLVRQLHGLRSTHA
jgi:hypothetical protein